MVAMTPEQLRDDALALFRASEVPEAFAWVNDLSPLHQRLFFVELADAIKDATLTGDLVSPTLLIDGWSATAELDIAPEVVAELRRPKQYKPLDAFSA